MEPKASNEMMCREEKCRESDEKRGNEITFESECEKM